MPVEPPVPQTIEDAWTSDGRWNGIRRDHSAEDVLRLRGSLLIEHTLARRGAEQLWRLLRTQPFVPALGALTGIQAVQMVKAGLKAIYVSGWQVAADNNLANETYPDQSLYPANSAPALVHKINKALQRADQIDHLEGASSRDWFAPIVADGEAGFGGPLNAFELTKSFIESGAAAVHFEDQLASAKKCGHMGGKVLIPTSQHVRSLAAARLAADVSDVPLLLIARTDARDATLLSSDADGRDHAFLTGQRTVEGYHVVRSGIEAAIARALAYAPYADMLWFETNTPDLAEAKTFADAIHAVHPDKMLAYNCSPSFNWKRHLTDEEIADFQPRLGKMGYKFQFVTLAGFHAVASRAFELAHGYVRLGMPAYVDLQEHEFALEPRGYTATRHQREVGTGYFDEVARIVVGRNASTLALDASTEMAQFVPGANGSGAHVKVVRRAERERHLEEAIADLDDAARRLQEAKKELDRAQEAEGPRANAQRRRKQENGQKDATLTAGSDLEKE